MYHPPAACPALILLCLLVPLSVAAQAPQEETFLDSLAVFDSTITVDPTLAYGPDTLEIDRQTPLKQAFRQATDVSSIVTEAEIPWIPQRSPGDILALNPSSYLRDPNVDGQYSQLNFRGADWRAVSVTADGRLMNDPASGVYNPNHFTTDFIERIEVVPGPRSFLYGLNAAGGSVNFVTRHYDSDRPYSKINFSEASHGYSYFDGTVSQNVTSRMNIALGFQRQIADGRFANSQHEAWNGRARIRYYINDKLSVTLSDYLTSTKTQLNGGVDPDNLENAFFPLQTRMRNEDSYEKLSRNDVDLSFVGYFIDDSSGASRLTLYYSNNFREYRDETGGTIPNAVFIQSDHTSSWMGALFTQQMSGDGHRLDLRANIEKRQIEGSSNIGRRANVIGSVDAKGELTLMNSLTIAAYGRYDRYLNKDYFGFGSDAKLAIAEGISLFGGGSFSWRLPTYQELYWTDSTVTRQDPIVEEEHRHVELGAEFSDEAIFLVRAAYFNRRVVNPILLLPYGSGFVFPGINFTNGDETISHGIDFRFWLRFWVLYVEGSGKYMTQEASSTPINEYPEFSGTGGIYFWNRIVDDNLHLKIGFRGRVQTWQRGTEFNAEVLAYVQNANESVVAGGSVDFVLEGRIGDANVHFIWENLTEVQYFATPFYPVRDRSIRFGIAWEFLD